MQKVIGMLAVIGLVSMMPLSSEAQPGGIGSALVGCCFGVRTAGAFNEGKQLHFRDWARLIPYAGVVFAVWDGVDGAQGMTSQQLQQTYGVTYY